MRGPLGGNSRATPPFVTNLPRPPQTLARDQGKLLEDYLQREERHLGNLKIEGASWLALFRQRRKIARGQRALEWADARQMGEDTFIWRHGVLGYGLGLFLTAELLCWGFGGFGVPSARGVIASLLVGVTVGAAGGFFSGWSEWEREEMSLARTLEALAPKPNEPSAR